jgi:catechol 2,3-dioxygenase-like lactoylglutathione lyase family enzyme
VDRKLAGIHHVTAIAGDPQQNIDFYTGVLGLRLVKLTVNFDDPATYHLYYGDGVGNPGTILTFFAWNGAAKGRSGSGMATSTALSIPEPSLDFWASRLSESGIVAAGPFERLGKFVLAFDDPDGLNLELVGSGGPDLKHVWTNGPVDSSKAIKGFHGVTIVERNAETTAMLLTRTMGLSLIAQEAELSQYKVDGDGPGMFIEVVNAPNTQHGHVAVGTVHHVAWRTPDDETQLGWLETLRNLSFNVSSVMDRIYFHSIYFREPGGVLFEIATDTPGFAVDEKPEALGSSLKLPPWYEPSRDEIEAAIRPLRLPARVGEK